MRGLYCRSIFMVFCPCHVRAGVRSVQKTSQVRDKKITVYCRPDSDDNKRFGCLYGNERVHPDVFVHKRNDTDV